MIKIDNKTYKKFVKIMEEYDEFLFGSDEEVKKQLELCLNRQGYWSACNVNIYYDEDTKSFYAKSRF